MHNIWWQWQQIIQWIHTKNIKKIQGRNQNLTRKKKRKRKKVRVFVTTKWYWCWCLDWHLVVSLLAQICPPSNFTSTYVTNLFLNFMHRVFMSAFSTGTHMQTVNRCKRTQKKITVPIYKSVTQCKIVKPILDGIKRNLFPLNGHNYCSYVVWFIKVAADSLFLHTFLLAKFLEWLHLNHPVKHPFSVSLEMFRWPQTLIIQLYSQLIECDSYFQFATIFDGNNQKQRKHSMTMKCTLYTQMKWQLKHRND